MNKNPTSQCGPKLCFPLNTTFNFILVKLGIPQSSVSSVKEKHKIHTEVLEIYWSQRMSQ